MNTEFLLEMYLPCTYTRPVQVSPYCRTGQTRTLQVMNTEILLTSLMSKPIDAGLMRGGASIVRLS